MEISNQALFKPAAPIKIALVANTGWYLYNFRISLARFLRSRGVEVILVCPHDAYVEKLQIEGFRWVNLKLHRRSLNPILELLTVARLAVIYRREKPTAVHHFTSKCVLYGTIAAKLSGTRAVVNAVTGLGYVFVGSGWQARTLRPLIKIAFRQILSARRVRSVVFQNPDDLKIFVDSKLIISERSVLIRGSGVDLKRFAPRSPWSEESLPVVLFAARLIGEKGVHQYVEAARLLKQRGVCARFQIAGAPDPGNPSSILERTCSEWRKEGVVELLGHVDGMDELIANASVVVLPSYYGEGVPRILLEAAAMAKPIVATNVPGCREAVDDGVTGLLVPVKDSAALAKALHGLLINGELRRRMGEAGRAKMIQEFDEDDVVQRTAALYLEMVPVQV